MRRATSLVLSSLFASSLLPGQSEAPRTVPEATGYAETSRLADVERFVDACLALPHGDRLQVRTAGKSHEDRALLLVRASLPAAGRDARPPLRALVIGNIHAGEVEGKEALQLLLREIATGQHEQLLRRCELWLLPIYNVDGNEAIAVGNRRGQNGPDAVGRRPNAQGLDLNRDLVKADAPETRALLRLFREVDPHLFVDLHTTNGSRHGYHLTYAPSLNPNIDPAVDDVGRALLAGARAAVRARGFETFDYGNFATRDWDGSGAPDSPDGVRGWYTYDHRPRYAVNYFGLRNRIGVLSEAYSYADFETRIAATRAFVLTLLEQLVRHEQDVRRALGAADARPASGRPLWHGSDTTFAAPERLPVLVGEVERVEGADGRPTRFERKDAATPETMPVLRRFQARRHERLPRGWAIPEPSPEVVQRLQWHGVAFAALRAPRAVPARRFAVDKKRKPKRPYQGHQELVLEGAWLPPETVRLALGTIVVRADQPLARLAAVLLEPRSEDSLSTWNFFEQATGAHYPVLRLLELPE